MYLPLFDVLTLNIQLSNDWTVFVQLSEGSKISEQQFIVKTVYVQLSDGWTVYVQLSNVWTVYVCTIAYILWHICALICVLL